MVLLSRLKRFITATTQVCFVSAEKFVLEPVCPCPPLYFRRSAGCSDSSHSASAALLPKSLPPPASTLGRRVREGCQPT